MKIIELFFNQPTKQWRFKDIKSRAKIADNKVSRWLKRYEKEGLIKRIKPEGRMPYYIADYSNPHYRTSKRLYAYQKLYDSGFLDYLTRLEDAMTIIIFGSFTRWDWHEDSDIDVFIYGNIKDLEKESFERKLSREIEIFLVKSRQELKRLHPDLIKDMIKGDLIKGDLDFLEVKADGEGKV